MGLGPAKPAHAPEGKKARVAHFVSLAVARQKAEDARDKLDLGIDPLEARQPVAKALKFGEVASAYIALMRPGWRNEKHAWQWETTLRKDAEGLQEIPVDEIDTQLVLKVLEPIWQSKHETAQRLRGRIERILDHARAKGLRSGENPARWRGHLDQLLPKRQRGTRGHMAALPYDQMADFITELRGREATAARMLEFVILTAARTGEALGASWDEIDTKRAIWTIPAIRMKAGVEHRVPLSDHAMQILDEMALAGRRGFVFTNAAERPLSNMAMLTLLKRMGRTGITVHGFRSAFRDWAAETTGFPHEVCEMALAHVISNKAEAAYRRGDLFEKRRELMDAWASYCEPSDASNVIRLR